MIASVKATGVKATGVAVLLGVAAAGCAGINGAGSSAGSAGSASPSAPASTATPSDPSTATTPTSSPTSSTTSPALPPATVSSPSVSAPEAITSAPVPAPGTTAPAGFTVAGAHLHLGDQAVIPAGSDAPGAAVGLRITKIEAGRPGDLTPDLGPQPPGSVPVYIFTTVTNLTGVPLATHGYANGPDIVIFTDAGRPADMTSAAVGPCRSRVAGAGFDHVGASYETCMTAIVPAGRTVTEVQYLGPFSMEAPMSPDSPGQPDYTRRPLSWTR